MVNNEHDRDNGRIRYQVLWAEINRQRDIIDELRREQVAQDARMKLLASLAFFVVGSVLPLTVVLWQAFGAR